VATIQYGTLSNEFTQIFRRQQDDLPAHVTKDVYFEDQGPGHPNTGYYLDTAHGKRSIEFIQVNDSYHWVRLRRNQDTWETNLSGIYNRPEVGWWLIINPQHPNYIGQGASVSHTIAAVTTALQQLPTRPNTPDYPTIMEGQQEDINVATGQAQVEAQRINIITPSNGALKGNPPFIFTGDRNTSRKFINNFDLWRLLNQHNDTMKKPLSRIVTLLSYMDGDKVDAWKEEQMHILEKAANDGVQETDEDLWKDFIERFRNAFTNQNQKEESYQKLCKLKQEDSLDDFFAKFKQLAFEAGVPLDDKGTIETLKHGMNKGLTGAIINSPNFDPTADVPWTFKQWEEQARQSHLKWKAAAEFTQRRQGLFQAFKLAPRQTNNPGRGGYGRNNNWRNKNDRRTTSQGGYHMDVDATVTQDINATISGQQHSEAKKADLMRSNSCFYCEKPGHRANVCRKKQADRGNFSDRSNNSREPTRVKAAPIMPDLSDPDTFVDYLKDNMDSFSEETRLGFVEKLMSKDFPAALN